MLRRDIVLDAPRADVWRALGDPDGLSAWFGAHVTGALAAGEQVYFRFPDGTERAASIEEIDPERRLVFRWLPFERAPDGSARTRLVTRVEFHLDDTADGTLIVIVERELTSSSRAAV